MEIARVALPGSERTLPENVILAGLPDYAETLSVTVILRRRKPLPVHDRNLRLSREEFESEFGADPSDVEQIEAFADQFDLTVGDVDLGRRSVMLFGTVAQMNEAFATQLRLFQNQYGLFRGRIGSLFIPATLEHVVQGVFGLDNRPQARAHRKRKLHARPLAAGDTSYTPIQVSQLYSYPTGATGAGQTVAIIELGGGYRSSDLKTYFSGLGIKTTPSVTAVSVDGATNSPAGDPNSDDGEVLLDIEVVGAIAPKARIAVYFGPNTDQGFLDAITTAVHDKVRKPSVVSISWGGAESTWTAQALQTYDQAFQDATVLGVTVCCASGDDGSNDGVSDGLAHVDFPASSPHVLACGGTRLQSTGTKIQSEVVWNEGAGNGASGGGVSETFPLPAFQSSAGVPVSVNPSKFKGRGVPDVSGDADPQTGYDVRVDGQNAVFGGTSAVAPLWAALTALLNQQLGKTVGYLNPLLYAKFSPSPFHDITSGNNGAYSATTGWDACTGLGSPNGAALLKALSGSHGKKGHKEVT